MIVGGFRRYHYAWCYWHYLRCNSADLASTSSQMCGSWNLPMFLLRDGSLTLIKIASLMFLAILLSSLPTILKLSRDTSWPVVFWWSLMGDGALMCSLNLSPKVLTDSPMYSSSQSTLPHLYLYITPLFLSMVSLSLAPRQPPYGEYITAIEQACLKLEPHNAEELRAAMREALRNSQEPTRNITKQEIQALVELKNDQSRVILTADKGVAIVIMDKEDYKEKAKALLEDQGTYKALKSVHDAKQLVPKLITSKKQDFQN